MKSTQHNVRPDELRVEIRERCRLCNGSGEIPNADREQFDSEMKAWEQENPAPPVTYEHEDNEAGEGRFPWGEWNQKREAQKWRILDGLECDGTPARMEQCPECRGAGRFPLLVNLPELVEMLRLTEQQKAGQFLPLLLNGKHRSTRPMKRGKNVKPFDWSGPVNWFLKMGLVAILFLYWAQLVRNPYTHWAEYAMGLLTALAMATFETIHQLRELKHGELLQLEAEQSKNEQLRRGIQSALVELGEISHANGQGCVADNSPDLSESWPARLCETDQRLLAYAWSVLDELNGGPDKVIPPSRFKRLVEQCRVFETEPIPD